MATENPLQPKLQAALDVIDTQPSAAISQLRDVLLGNHPNDVESLKVKEKALDALAGVLVKQQDTGALRTLLTDLRPWFGVIPKAKTAKIVRTIIESIGQVPNSNQVLVRPNSTSFFTSPRVSIPPSFSPAPNNNAVGSMPGTSCLGCI